MYIPPYWAKETGEFFTAEGRTRHLAVWGWSDQGPAAARMEAAERLQRLGERVLAGRELQREYAYGSRPLREEIVETLGGKSGEPSAIVTRNRYGALVLNTARVLFLDVDLPKLPLGRRLKRFLGLDRSDPVAEELDRLRERLERARNGATFRLYRTAAGFRALAIDREFDPAGSATEELMKRTGADPAFMHLCRLQESFRARLTPKPWRCRGPLPPGQHPREEPELRARFDDWLDGYHQASARFATCRYLETLGSGSVMRSAEPIVALHDSATRCREPLPLA